MTLFDFDFDSLDSVVDHGAFAHQLRRFGGRTLPRHWYLRRFLLGHPDLHHYFDFNFYLHPELALNIWILLIIQSQNFAHVYGAASALVSSSFWRYSGAKIGVELAGWVISLLLIYITILISISILSGVGLKTYIVTEIFGVLSS